MYIRKIINLYATVSFFTIPEWCDVFHIGSPSTSHKSTSWHCFGLVVLWKKSFHHSYTPLVKRQLKYWPRYQWNNPDMNGCLYIRRIHWVLIWALWDMHRVLAPNPQQWLMIDFSNLMMIKLNTNILTLIKREMDKMKTLSPMYIVGKIIGRMNIIVVTHSPEYIRP